MALEFLAQARGAAKRLDDQEDVEALHDFRVGIRRLRSTLRAYRPQLKKAASKKQRGALRDLQQATSKGRDLEVQLEWLEPQREELMHTHRVGFDWLVERLRAKKDAAYGKVRKSVPRKFGKVQGSLRRSLECMTIKVHLLDESPQPTFAGLLASQVRSEVAEVLELMRDVRTLEDAEQAHQARIACKRLRYLLEPVRKASPEARPLVRECKALQDLLGEIQDVAVLLDELGRAIQRAAGDRARHLHELALNADEQELRRESRRAERPGLIEVTRRVKARVDALFRALERDWLGEGVEQLAARVETFALSLDEIEHGSVEIERKFLLDAVPDEVHGVPGMVIEQGWLPGKKLRERIRKITTSDGVTFRRTVKLGQGLRRIEIEEETTLDVFEALWPLTAGCRVIKRRYALREGSLVWEIDEFSDRDLVLAEVELPTADTEVEIPSWLSERVVREVTGDSTYVNLRLAR